MEKFQQKERGGENPEDPWKIYTPGTLKWNFQF